MSLDLVAGPHLWLILSPKCTVSPSSCSFSVSLEAGQLETGEMTVFQCPHRQIEGGDRIQHQQHGAVIRILQDNRCKDRSVSGMWYALSKTSGAPDVSRGDASKMLGTVPSTRKSSATAVKCYLRYPIPTPDIFLTPLLG